MVSKNMPNYPHHIPNYLPVMNMMMRTGMDSTDQPKGPFGYNNGHLHAETAHPDEKQHHMVSKNMPNYQIPHPKLLTRRDGDADWHGVDSPRVH
jgi:hypothetical protein